MKKKTAKPKKKPKSKLPYAIYEAAPPDILPEWVVNPSPSQTIRCPNVIVFADPHFASRLGLCTRKPLRLDEGGSYVPSALQLKVCDYWDYAWNEWVPEATHGEPFVIVFNGDAYSGRPFNTNLEISENPADARHLAMEVMQPVVARAQKFYLVKGTEVHVGKSAHTEEALAEELGAVPNEYGQYARYDLWLKVGNGLCHFLHHIGTTGSAHYETTALCKELVDEYQQAARYGEARPDIVVRSHRHIFDEIRITTDTGYGICFVTPGWQLKTPHVWRIPGGRIAPPQFGLSLIRQGDVDLFTRHWVKTIGRTKTEVA